MQINRKKRKKWQIMPKISKSKLEEFKEVNEIILQLLTNRGIDTREEIDEFFSNTLDPKKVNPFLFKNMEEAVALIIKHIKAENQIFIYGDYDADGVTSSALLRDILELLKGKVEVYLPDRVSEGYGLNNNAIDYIKKQGGKLIVTVDGGIRSREEIAHAQSMGIEVLVTDHHPSSGVEEDLPNCLIINSTLPEETYPYKNLAGVGVAYKLAMAIISKAKLSDANKKLLEKRLLDLVAIGTVADCVPLIGENRILVKSGLKALNNTKRIGLIELLKVSGVKDGQELKSWNIGFQIGPRINAAGRMDHANSAYKLLIAKDIGKAKKLAISLNQRNIERQQITEEIVTEVISQVDEEDDIIIGVCEDDIWNEGVVGLVAGRVCEKYYKPTLVITKTIEGYKGSGRSIPEFNLAEAIENCSEYLDKYGGHPLACGFSFLEENLNNFRNKLKKIAKKKMKDVETNPSVFIDIELNAIDINEEMLEKIKQFEPYGQKNEQPKFVSRLLTIKDMMFMGLEGQHVKLMVKSEESNLISAIGFNQSEAWKDLQIDDIVDIVYYLDLNEFNGRKEVQMKIIDIAKSSKK